jgi:HAE1 family hydrophobic/amphiphilic exporter-1
MPKNLYYCARYKLVEVLKLGDVARVELGAVNYAGNTLTKSIGSHCHCTNCWTNAQEVIEGVP